jgi:hypothetical protein
MKDWDWGHAPNCMLLGPQMSMILLVQVHHIHLPRVAGNTTIRNMIKRVTNQKVAVVPTAKEKVASMESTRNQKKS